LGGMATPAVLPSARRTSKPRRWGKSQFPGKLHRHPSPSHAQSSILFAQSCLNCATTTDTVKAAPLGREWFQPVFPVGIEVARFNPQPHPESLRGSTKNSRSRFIGAQPIQPPASLPRRLLSFFPNTPPPYVGAYWARAPRLVTSTPTTGFPDFHASLPRRLLVIVGIEVTRLGWLRGRLPDVGAYWISQTPRLLTSAPTGPGLPVS